MKDHKDHAALVPHVAATTQEQEPEPTPELEPEGKHVATAAAYLDAVNCVNHWAYFAHETGEAVLVTAADMRRLGLALENGTPDAYSLWCALPGCGETITPDDAAGALLVTAEHYQPKIAAWEAAVSGDWLSWAAHIVAGDAIAKILVQNAELAAELAED